MGRGQDRAVILCLYNLVTGECSTGTGVQAADHGAVPVLPHAVATARSRPWPRLRRAPGPTLWGHNRVELVLAEAQPWSYSPMLLRCHVPVLLRSPWRPARSKVSRSCWETESGWQPGLPFCTPLGETNICKRLFG